MKKCNFCNSPLEDHREDTCYSQRIHLWGCRTMNAVERVERFTGDELKRIRDEHPLLMKSFETGVWEG
jgi:hypothetical protein